MSDAFVYSATPDSNYGGSSELFVKHSLGDPHHRKAYLRFDLSAAHTAPLVNATLRLTVGSTVQGIPPVGLQVFAVWGLRDVSTGVSADELPGAGGWAEGTSTEGSLPADGITWTTAPANDLSSGWLLNADAVHLGDFTIEGLGTPGQHVEFTSRALAAMIGEDTNDLLTVIVTRVTVEPAPGGSFHNFRSHESGTSLAPTLLLAFPADLQRDCVVDGADLGILLGAWGPCLGVPCVGDLNDDGVVDGADLGMLLGAWTG